jgi:poly(A) polymerase
MLRAIALAARLEFTIDRDTAEAIRVLRGEIVKSSSARILDEFYKILRAGASQRTFQALHDHGLLAYLLPEAGRAIDRDGAALLGSLGRLDEHRKAGLAAAEQLTNPILLGTMLVPLGVPLRRPAPPQRPAADEPGEDGSPPAGPADDVARELAALGEAEEPAPPGPPSPLSLPFARRDLDRLRLILVAQRRLGEVHRAPGVKHALAARPYFDESVRWLEIHGGLEGQELAAHWRSLDLGDLPMPAPGAPAEAVAAPLERAAPRRRRRRRRRRPAEPAKS